MKTPINPTPTPPSNHSQTAKTNPSYASEPLQKSQHSQHPGQTLAKLNNTWVKVVASEPLTPEQSQRALRQTALPQEPSAHTKPEPAKSQSTQPEPAKSQATQPEPAKPQVTQPEQTQSQAAKPEPAQSNHKQTTQEIAGQKSLHLLTLKHANGEIRLLSVNHYPVNSQVLIGQNEQGNWTLAKPSGQFSLNQLMQSNASILSKPLSLIDDHQLTSLLSQSSQGPSNQQALQSALVNSPINQLLKTLNIELPKLSLNSQTIPNPQQVQQGLNFSGQFFEQHLMQQANAAGTGTDSLASSAKGQAAHMGNQVANELKGSLNGLNTLNHSGTNAGSLSSKSQSQESSNLSSNVYLNQQLKKVEFQIQKWIHQLAPSLQGAQAQPHQTQANQLQTNQGQTNQGQTNQAQQHTANKKQTMQNPLLQTSALPNGQSSFNLQSSPSFQGGLSLNSEHISVNKKDMKAWLVNSQFQLLNHLLPKQNGQMTWGEKLSQEQQSQLKQAAPLLSLLLQSKPSQADGNLPIWPANLSAQQQLNQLLNQQVPLLMSGDEQQDDTLRLLLNISQQLNRLQGEQINSRLMQQHMPDMNQLQFSLPYLHQQQVNWCQFEWQGSQQQEQASEQGISWHLILRFAQHQQEAFAIESQMIQSRLHITLWAEQQSQLKHLHQHIPVLQKRLNKAGFQLENIQSKHGMPPVKQNPISNSLVDIRT